MAMAACLILAGVGSLDLLSVSVGEMVGSANVIRTHFMQADHRFTLFTISGNFFVYLYMVAYSLYFQHPVVF